MRFLGHCAIPTFRDKSRHFRGGTSIISSHILNCAVLKFSRKLLVHSLMRAFAKVDSYIRWLQIEKREGFNCSRKTVVIIQLLSIVMKNGIQMAAL